MLPGEMLKYGKINEKSGGADVVPVTMVASQVVKARSGRFVFQVDGAATLVVASSTRIYGVLNTHEHTPTVGDIIGCDISKDAIYRIPVNSGTYVIAMIGDSCDLAINGSDIQGAVLGTSTRDHVIIVDGDAVNNKWVDVKMNDAIWGTGAGADD